MSVTKRVAYDVLKWFGKMERMGEEALEGRRWRGEVKEMLMEKGLSEREEM